MFFSSGTDNPFAQSAIHHLYVSERKSDGAQSAPHLLRHAQLCATCFGDLPTRRAGGKEISLMGDRGDSDWSLIKRAVALAAKLRGVGCGRPDRRRDEVEIDCTSRPCHLRRCVPELTSEVLRNIVELVDVADGVPLHSVGHNRWHRTCATTDYCVHEIEVVLHMKILNLDRRSSGAQIDARMVLRHDARPEQTVLRDTRVEVVDLRRRIPQTGVVDVDSGEDECRAPDVTVSSLEAALHESHVVERIRQRSRLTGLAIGPLYQTADEGDADGSVEIVDAGRIRIDSRERGRLHVEVLTGDGERRGDGRHKTYTRSRLLTFGTRGRRTECGGKCRQTGCTLEKLAARNACPVDVAVSRVRSRGIPQRGAYFALGKNLGVSHRGSFRLGGMPLTIRFSSYHVKRCARVYGFLAAAPALIFHECVPPRQSGTGAQSRGRWGSVQAVCADNSSKNRNRAQSVFIVGLSPPYTGAARRSLAASVSDGRPPPMRCLVAEFNLQF